MKVGDILYCKESLITTLDKIELVKGHNYIVIDTSIQPYVKVINQLGNYNWYGVVLFSDLKEVRKEKLKKINENNKRAI